VAYPGEKTHKEYMDYVTEMQSKGETPLKKEEWLKSKKDGKTSQATPEKPILTAMSKY